MLTPAAEFETGVLRVGDRIEWIDYDDAVSEGVVEVIQYKALAGPFEMKDGPLLEIPMWEREDYVLYLGNGFSIVGDLVKTKLKPDLRILK